MDEKILGLYASGMNQRDISEQIKSLCDVDISPELVSKISERRSQRGRTGTWRRCIPSYFWMPSSTM